jgi:hypothetical protein
MSLAKIRPNETIQDDNDDYSDSIPENAFRRLLPARCPC